MSTFYLILYFSLFFTTTLTESLPYRQLLQRQRNTRVIIEEENVESLVSLLTEADRGTEFEIRVPTITLDEVVTIESRGVSLVGRENNPPVEVQCSGEGKLNLSGENTSVRNLRFENCQSGALAVLNPAAVFDPFDLEADVEFDVMKVEIDGVEFVGNTAGEDEQQGGALRVGPGTDVSIKNCLFQNNSASTGGAILVDGGGTLDLRHSVLQSNQAVLAGGAIAAGISQNFFETEATIFIKNCTFLDNMDTSGGEDITGLTLSNGAPLENSVFLTFPSPSPSAGGIYVQGFEDVEIQQCVFGGNKATPAGGALYISDNKKVLVNNCTFDNNGVISKGGAETEGQNFGDRIPDLELGGAIYLVFTEVRSQAKIDRCLFRNNTAAFGGAIHTVTQLATKLSIENSQFEDNYADLAAGGVLMRNTIQSKIRNVRFLRNRATSGGGMVLTNGAGAYFFKGPSTGIELDVYFTENEALDGGGIFLLGAGQTLFQSARFEGNKARRNGGAVCLIESLPSGKASLQASYFRENSGRRGGAVYMDSIAQMDVLVVDEETRNEFIGNKALAGGAMHIRPSSQVNNYLRISSADFRNNLAVASDQEAEIHNLNLPEIEVESSLLGRKLLFHRALTQTNTQQEETLPMPKLLDPDSLDGCNPGGGGALCLLISQAPERAPIEVLLLDLKFNKNTARVGGGLFLSTNTDKDWIALCDSSGSAVESLTAKPCKAISISQIEFNSNEAEFAGGALFCSNPTSVYYQAASNGRYITLDELSLTEEIFQENKVQKGGFGPNLASNAASLQIIRPDISPPEDLFRGHNSGKELEGGIELLVLDIYNQAVTSGIQDSSMSVSINSTIVSGQRVAVAENGLLNFTRVIARGRPRRHLLRFEPNSLTTQSIERNFTIRQCYPGEFRIHDQNICDECREEYFGFNYSYNCDGCPDNAHCPGAATLVPKQGYWHSTPFSPIMHECILEDACSYDGRTGNLRRFFKNGSELVVSNHTLSNEEYPQCADGYEGVLCGSCAKNHGHVIDGECVECEALWLTAILICVVCIWTLFLLISTARQAFDTIREMHDMRLVRVLTKSNDKEGSKTQTSSEPNKGGAGGALDSSQGSQGTDKKFTSQSGDENVDHIMAAEKVAEIIKILTNFLQITAVGVGINVSWTDSITFLLVVEDSISSISSGASFAPMECLIKELEDRSLIGIVLRALFPLILTGVYVMANVFKSRSDPKSLKRRVIIGVIVGLFFAYDTVSEMLMRIVCCVSLDDVKEDDEDAPNVIQRYGIYATSRESYWAEDTRHVCWKDSHGIVAGVLGIPGLVLFTFGLPFLLAAFLMYKRRQEVVLEPEFLNTYGFVYQSYRVKFVFWESIVMLRKASMAAVIVYSYDLGPNLQSAIALGILIFALLAQFLAQPFKYKSLNVLESLSLLASIFVFYAGIIFRDPNTSYAGKVVLSIIILCTNVSLVGLFLHRLFMAYDNLIVVKLRMAKSPIPDTVFQRIKQLSLVQAEKVKEKLATSRKSGIPQEQLPEASESNASP